MIETKERRVFGLIGYPLSHSFSKKYFSDKFEAAQLTDHQYELFPLASIQDFPALLESHSNLNGLNVTIPYKEQVIPFLDEVSPEAREIGAVNTIRLTKGKKEGFNTDVYGFETSLLNWVPIDQWKQKLALILGTGGASKAVAYTLKKQGVSYKMVSRTVSKGDLTYTELNQLDWKEIGLVVNTTPLGMYPDISSCPSIPYTHLNKGHYLMDLVYNPEKPLFLLNGEKQGSSILNGLEMLHLQAEKAWEIWNS